MRIGFDAKKMVTNSTGIGNYSRSLVRLMLAEGCECVLFAPEAGEGLPAGAECVCAPHKSRLGREWWRCRDMVKDIRERHIDLFHGLSNELPFGMERAGCKSAVTIHDLIFLRFPDTYGRAARHILKAKTTYACRHADHIIAASECTKRDLMDFYGVEEKRISVVYQGCAPAFRHPLPAEVLAAIRKRSGLPPCYILCVATLEPRKNQKAVLRAAALLPGDVHVVLVGKSTPWQGEVEACAKGLPGLQGRVHILNHVPTADLPALYQACSAFVYPSFFEGFGIPVLEAMASGVPVVASSGSCLEEVGGKAALYCPPEDHEGMAKAIRDILDDPAGTAARVKAGLEQAGRFADKDIAKRLLEVYRQTLQS